MNKQAKAENPNAVVIPASPDSEASTPVSQEWSSDGRSTDTASPHESGGLAPVRRGATGPRTSAGKRRSRYNAVKHRLFAKAILLNGESLVEYEALRNGLWEEYEPEGSSGIAEYEYLVTLYWRRWRAVKAENAQIAIAAKFDAYKSKRAQLLEVWDQSRAGAIAGGMLRYSSNPLVIRTCIGMLTIFRNNLDRYGFDACRDTWLLAKVYGLDHDGEAPVGLFRTFLLQSKLATGGQIGNKGSRDDLRTDPNELKNEMVTAFDKEIERLQLLETAERTCEKKMSEYLTLAALIPPPEIMDGIIRCQTHTSREIERTISHLENARRRRHGQPESPTLRLKIDD